MSIFWIHGSWSENVKKYIPSNCFIDYREFRDNEEMYQYIISMTEAEHEGYIRNIAKFLQSKKAHLFSQEYFDKLLCEAAAD